MKTQLRIGSDTKSFEAVSFKRAYLLVQIVPNVSGVYSSTNLDLTKLRTTINIKQANIDESTSFDAVAPTMLGCLKSFSTTALQDIRYNATGLTCQGKYQSDDLLTLEIPLLFGGYVLKGDDKISFDIDIIPGFFDSACDNSSSVYLVTEQDADIVQTDINLPIYYPITRDKNSPSFNEKAVSEVYLLNTETGIVYNDSPFNALELRSDFINDRFDSVTMAQMRSKYNNQVSPGVSNKFYNVEPSAVTDVQINLDIVSSKVNTGVNFLFVSRVCMSEALTKRAVRHVQKVNRKKASIRGVKY